MKPVPGNESRVLCADLLAPEGYGEVIGGLVSVKRTTINC